MWTPIISKKADSYYNITLISNNNSHYLNIYINKVDENISVAISKSEDGFYLHRENMVEDLTKNYLKSATKYERIIFLLGQPENLNDEEENTISYELMTDFGWDIDPVEVKTLKIKISKDSTLLNYKIEHWKK